MLTERQKRLFREIPKAENHIHIEGSIPWDLALQLAERNHVKLPYNSLAFFWALRYPSITTSLNFPVTTTSSI